MIVPLRFFFSTLFERCQFFLMGPICGWSPPPHFQLWLCWNSLTPMLLAHSHSICLWIDIRFTISYFTTVIDPFDGLFRFLRLLRVVSFHLSKHFQVNFFFPTFSVNVSPFRWRSLGARSRSCRFRFSLHPIFKFYWWDSPPPPPLPFSGIYVGLILSEVNCKSNLLVQYELWNDSDWWNHRIINRIPIVIETAVSEIQLVYLTATLFNYPNDDYFIYIIRRLLIKLIGFVYQFETVGLIMKTGRLNPSILNEFRSFESFQLGWNFTQPSNWIVNSFVSVNCFEHISQVVDNRLHFSRCLGFGAFLESGRNLNRMNIYVKYRSISIVYIFVIAMIVVQHRLWFCRWWHKELHSPLLPFAIDF